MTLNRRDLEELSAYLDGEAKRPEETARRLQGDAALARRHIEWQKLSAHLRALPRPAPDPAFVSRVVARVEEAQPAVRQEGVFAWLTPMRAMAVTALLVVCGGAVLWQAFLQSPRAATPGSLARPLATGPAVASGAEAGADSADAATLVDWTDDQFVVAALTTLLASGEDVGVFETYGEAYDIVDDGLSMDAVVGLLVDSDWVEPGWDERGYSPYGSVWFEELAPEAAQWFEQVVDENLEGS